MSGTTQGYSEYRPSEKLRNLVQCYWVMRTPGHVVSARSHQVLPDGCMDILFDLETEQADVVGTLSRMLSVPMGGRFDLFGVRFKPGAAFLFIGAAAHEFTDKTVSLKETVCLWRTGIFELLKDCRSDRERILLMNRALESRLGLIRPHDSAFTDFVDKVMSSQSFGTSVSALQGRVGMSQRTLERYFLQRIGVTAKTFLRIFRFRRLLHDGFSSRESRSWSDLAAGHGYHDQAHLIHEFKEITGQTPKQFVLNDPTLSDFYNTTDGLPG